MSAPRWTFEISRMAETRKRRAHPSRPWVGDYGASQAVAATEDEARSIVTKSLESWGRLDPNDGPYVAGDLLEVRARGLVLWSNFGWRGDPYMPNPAKRYVAAANALAWWRASHERRR